MKEDNMIYVLKQVESTGKRFAQKQWPKNINVMAEDFNALSDCIHITFCHTSDDVSVALTDPSAIVFRVPEETVSMKPEDIIDMLDRMEENEDFIPIGKTLIGIIQ